MTGSRRFKMLHGAFRRGVLDGYTLTEIKNPYKRKDFRQAWADGYKRSKASISEILLKMGDKPVYIPCDRCGEEKMTADTLDGRVVFRCEACGFTVDNIQVNELQDSEAEGQG